MAFVTSPNCDYIYYPPKNARMTFKMDGRLGDDDPLQWPQPYIPDQCHLPCIPRQTDNNSLGILFHKIVEQDFHHLLDTSLSGLGYLSHRLIIRLRQFIQRMIEPHFARWITQHDSLPDNYKATRVSLFPHLYTLIHRSMRHLDSLPLMITQVFFVFAELQRYLLEYIACKDYMDIYKPRMDGTLPRAVSIADVIGAFVVGPDEADSFVRAGIPVWFIREAKFAGAVRVDALVEPRMAADHLCMMDAYHLHRVSYSGPGTHINKYRVFAEYSRSYLTRSSNGLSLFDSQPSTPSPAIASSSSVLPASSLSLAPPSPTPTSAALSLTSCRAPWTAPSKRNVPKSNKQRGAPCKSCHEYSEGQY